MSNAGQEVIAGRIPGEMIGSPSIRTSSVGSITTTETEVDTITVPTVIGRRYRITFDGQVLSTVADGYARFRIREDSTSGTQLQLRQTPTTIAASQSAQNRMVAFYTADATEDKTIKVTAIRQAGTGTVSAQASSDAPALLFVEYIDG